MATKKKDLLEQESISMECELTTGEVAPEISLESADEAGNSSAAVSTENELELDELLNIMDESAEASAPSDPSESAPPELSEANPVIEPEAGNLPSDTAAGNRFCKTKTDKKESGADRNGADDSDTGFRNRIRYSYRRSNVQCS